MDVSRCRNKFKKKKEEKIHKKKIYIYPILNCTAYVNIL